INVLCGVGILSTPYAAKEGGWLGLIILLTFAVLSFYTGLLLRQCLDSSPELETYPDIGQAAFGSTGRIALSASCVDYIILEGDNLSSLFPNAHISLGGFDLNSRRLFSLMTTLAVLPTVWLRDLSVLSYISAGGVVASFLVVFCLFWVGLVDQVGFQNKGTVLNLSTLPVAVGLYAVMGYKMFGEATESQFTLNMPKDLVASKIAVWATVSAFPSSVSASLSSSMSETYTLGNKSTIFELRELKFFFFLVAGLVLSLIGSLLTMLVTLILPPACYLSILRGKVGCI
ncbi:hypothetical protein Goklo_005088, partial [Gossypium klotzschianum]|nr:hypothetical protein [Gossypium klotzschianum]